MAIVDDRLCRMAQVLVRYSLNVQPGNLVAIQGGSEAIPLLREIYREILRAGGNPELKLEMEEAREIYLKEANEDQLNFVSPVTQLITERYDCLLYIDACRYALVATGCSGNYALVLYPISNERLCAKRKYVLRRLLGVRLQCLHAQRTRPCSTLARDGCTAKNIDCLVKWAQRSTYPGRRH